MIEMTRRQAVVALATPVVLAAATAEAQQAAPLKGRVTLVLVNDLDRMADERGRGGHAKLAAVVKAERAKGNCLFVHAGDAYSPSILAGFDKGAHIVDLLNRIKPDIFVPGNHEFDFGPDNFRTRIKESRFEILAANVAEPNGELVANTKRTAVLEVAGFKIGFVGCCTEDTVFLASPGNIKFEPAMAVARKHAAELRQQGVDLVVGVVHIGFGQDMQLVRSGAFDLVLSGHDHDLVTWYNGRSALVESASQADFVTAIDLDIERTVRDGQTRVSWAPTFRPMDTISVQPDPDIQAVIKQYSDALDGELNVPVGVTSTVLDSRRGTLRGNEVAIGNLICDAMRDAVDADICITNSGGIRADREYAAGSTITRKQILEELPFGNKTVLLEVTGKVVREAIENGLRGGGRFPQVSGMVVRGDITKPEGQRVLAITINGQPLDENRTYKLATNDFMARGGDSYSMLVGQKALIDALAGQYMAGHVMAYFQKKGTVSPVVEGRLNLTR